MFALRCQVVDTLTVKEVVCEEHAGIMEASVIYLEAMDAQPCPNGTIGTPLPSPSIQATTSKKPKSGGEPLQADLTNRIPSMSCLLHSWCPCSPPQDHLIGTDAPCVFLPPGCPLQNMPDGVLRP